MTTIQKLNYMLMAGDVKIDDESNEDGYIHYIFDKYFFDRTDAKYNDVLAQPRTLIVGPKWYATVESYETRDAADHTYLKGPLVNLTVRPDYPYNI